MLAAEAAAGDLPPAAPAPARAYVPSELVDPAKTARIATEMPTSSMPAADAERTRPRSTRAGRKAQAKARKEEKAARKRMPKDRRKAAPGKAAESPGPKPAKRKAAGKAKQPKAVSAQETLPFAGIAADGTIMVAEGVYSRIVRFGDVDYKLARREDREAMFERWCEILNSFDASVGVDLTCVNRRPDPGELAELGDVGPRGDALDPVRADYADMVAARAAAASGGLIKEHVLAFSVKARDAREARSRLARVESKLSGDLHTLGVRSSSLGRADVIRTMARICRAPVPTPAALDRRTMSSRGLGPKDLISPSEFDFGHADWYRCGRTFKRAGHLQINAPELSDEVLADLLGGDVPMGVSIHLDPMDPAAGKKLVNAKASDIDKMKIEEQKKAIRAGYDPDILPPELANFSEEARRLSREIEKENERLFDATVTVTVEGRDMRELRDAYFAADAIAQGHNCKLRPLRYLQEHAFAASLPLGVARLPISRTLTTSAAAAFVPFTAAELRTGGEALYYGVNAVTRNLIVADRKLLKNPNGLILGIPGGGKSFSAKGEIVAVMLLTDDDVIICDPEGEYGPVVRACGGQVVRISATSPHHVNPMDINLDYSDDDNPLALKSDFVLSLIEVIMGGKTGLTAAEKSVVDRCLPKVYAGYLADPRPENMPVLGDLYECLLEQAEPEAAGIATALEIYVNGSLSVFNHRTDVELGSRAVCFDIKDLGKQLKRLGMLVVQDQVWNRVTENRAAKRSTRYYVDEFHLLLRDEQTAAYMVEIWKRFRKWGGIPTGITQNVKDLLASREIENILDNSDFIMMLSQAAGDRGILAKHLGISDQQLNFVTNAESGCGLLFYGDVIVPFENKYEPGTRLYNLLTTKLGEAA